jgi:hypothetical protein
MSEADQQPVATDAHAAVAEEISATPVTARRPQRIVAAPRKEKQAPASAESAVDPVDPVAVSAPAAPEPGGSLIQNRMAMATAAKQRSKDNRRAKRVASRKLASLWNDKMSAALSCTMLDRSSTGAKLEVLEDRYNDRMNDIRVGDHFTVSVNYAQETTSIDCEVMWVAGRRCGVRFCGQIVTKVNKPAKRALPLKAPEKQTAGSSIKSLFGVGQR